MVGIEKKTGWTKVKGAAKYMGLSPRTVRDLFKGGLKHVQMPTGTILLKYAWADEFLKQYEKCENVVDDAANEICKGLK